MTARIQIAGVELAIDNSLEWTPAPTEDRTNLRVSRALVRVLNRHFSTGWSPAFGVYVPDSSVAIAEDVVDIFGGVVLEARPERAELRIY